MAGEVDVIVMISGDVLTTPAAIEILVSQFSDRKIGVAGGRPVPEPGKNGLLKRMIQTMWRVHHQMVLLEAKTTEVTAFRPLRFKLDEMSLVDEAEIEYHLTRAGLKIVYCPTAIVRNTLPGSFRDHIRQRTRVTLGHLVLAVNRKYRVSSLKTSVRMKALRNHLVASKPDLPALFCLLAVEFLVWIIAQYDYRARKHAIRGVWPRIDSAKVNLPHLPGQDTPEAQLTATVTIIVPVHNGGDDFNKCLAALSAAQPPPDEIIFVADGESDGAWRAARDYPATVLKLPVAGGPAMFVEYGQVNFFAMFAKAKIAIMTGPGVKLCGIENEVFAGPDACPIGDAILGQLIVIIA